MAEAAQAQLHKRAGEGARWRSRAFGMDLDLGFAAPPLPRAPDGEPADDPTTVDLVYADSIDDVWPDGGRRTGRMGPAERPVMVVDEHPEAGYRITLPPYGRYLVSADGRSIGCAPPSVAWWYWQRLLIGQVLPAAAALRGYEVLHASAVAIGDRAIAFAGDSGLGKSSLALRLLQGGATLVAEDVLTVHERDGRLLTEPGAAMVNLRESESARIEAPELERMGAAVGASHGKRHVIVDREDRTLELRRLYLLERGAPGDPTFAPVEAPGARDVFVNSFVNYVLRADRLVTQLDIAACLARTVPIVRLRVKPGMAAGELAELVRADAESHA
jgi:hypothetical protein